MTNFSRRRFLQGTGVPIVAVTIQTVATGLTVISGIGEVSRHGQPRVQRNGPFCCGLIPFLGSLFQSRRLATHHVTERTPHLLLGANVESAPRGKGGMFVEGPCRRFGVVSLLRFGKFVLQSTTRKLPQLAFGMKNEGLSPPVATALHGRERVHG